MLHPQVPGTGSRRSPKHDPAQEFFRSDLRTGSGGGNLSGPAADKMEIKDLSARTPHESGQHAPQPITRPAPPQ